MTADVAPLALAIGHSTDVESGTGLTVVRGVDAPFRCGATVLGRATGTRELDVLSARHLVDRVDAVLLTGGSAYGLAAADGVMRWMEERGRGFAVAGGVVPIVPAAVIFDLSPIGRFDARPTAAMAYDACEAATTTQIAEGSVGAGTGATVGKGMGVGYAMKGGLGIWTERAGPTTVAALAVVNAIGDVRDGEGRILAGARAPAGGFQDVERSLRSMPAAATQTPFQHTTLAIVATNALLDRESLVQLSAAAAAALYRRITPVGTSYDGDVIFAISPLEGDRVAALRLEVLAVHALEQAVERAVRLAHGADGIPGFADGSAG